MNLQDPRTKIFALIRALAHSVRVVQTRNRVLIAWLHDCLDADGWRINPPLFKLLELPAISNVSWMSCLDLTYRGSE